MDAEIRDERPFALERSSCHAVTASDGREYQVMLAWPADPPPASGFPVIVLLDASTSFATLVEGGRLRARRSDATGIVPAVFVGIDHAGDARERRQRTFDYTSGPPHDPQLIDGDPSGGAAYGGASAFLTFLQREVAAFAGRTLPVPIDRQRQSLFGHSMAGLFVLQALLSGAASYANYVAISPSLWWDRPGMFGAVTALSREKASDLARCRVLIGVAEYDQTLAPWQQGARNAAAIADRRRLRRMVDDAREFAEVLRPLTARTDFKLFGDEDHASVVARGLGRALRFCLGAP